MASFLIHIIVGNEVNKHLKRNNNKLLLGTIAPDIAKYVGISKSITHFTSNNNIPDLDKFLSLYKDKFNDDFVLGYYIHLYTDYLWFKFFIPKYYNNNKLHLIDGSIVNTKDITSYIYNDYTTLNKSLISNYNIDLNFLNNDIKLDNIIKEMPYNKIDILTYECLKLTNINSNDKLFVIDLVSITDFITYCVNILVKIIMEEIK